MGVKLSEIRGRLSARGCLWTAKSIWGQMWFGILGGYDEKGLAPSIYQGNLKVPDNGWDE